MRSTGRVVPTRLPIQRGVKIPPVESIEWYWHPNRAGVRLGPRWFREKLQAFHPDLEVTWDPVHENYLIWCRAPRIQHPICQGWKKLETVAPWKLDNRVFAYLYARAGEGSGLKNETGRAYFERLVAENEREQANAARFRQSERDAMSRETYRDRIRPSVCGFHAKVS